MSAPGGSARLRYTSSENMSSLRNLLLLHRGLFYERPIILLHAILYKGVFEKKNVKFETLSIKEIKLDKLNRSNLWEHV